MFGHVAGPPQHFAGRFCSASVQNVLCRMDARIGVVIGNLPILIGLIIINVHNVVIGEPADVVNGLCNNAFAHGIVRLDHLSALIGIMDRGKLIFFLRRNNRLSGEHINAVLLGVFRAQRLDIFDLNLNRGRWLKFFPVHHDTDGQESGVAQRDVAILRTKRLRQTDRALKPAGIALLEFLDFQRSAFGDLGRLVIGHRDLQGPSVTGHEFGHDHECKYGEGISFKAVTDAFRLGHDSGRLRAAQSRRGLLGAFLGRVRLFRRRILRSGQISRRLHFHFVLMDVRDLDVLRMIHAGSAQLHADGQQRLNLLSIQAHERHIGGLGPDKGAHIFFQRFADLVFFHRFQLQLRTVGQGARGRADLHSDVSHRVVKHDVRGVHQGREQVHIAFDGRGFIHRLAIGIPTQKFTVIRELHVRQQLAQRRAHRDTLGQHCGNGGALFVLFNKAQGHVRIARTFQLVGADGDRLPFGRFLFRFRGFLGGRRLNNVRCLNSGPLFGTLLR